MIDAGEIAVALGLPAGAEISVEPLGEGRLAPVRATIGGGAMLLARRLDDEAAANHAAVLEALARCAYPFAPRLVALAPDLIVEEWVDGADALAVVPPPGAFEAAMEALAVLHALPLHEGLRWESEPGAFYPAELALHRLGFAAHERERAAPGLAAARAALVEGPFGFGSGAAAAGDFRLSSERAAIVRFDAAGFGPQLADVAAFLLTSGVGGAGRRVLAMRYAQVRGIEAPATAGLVDLAGIAWGLGELMALPRRQVESLGDGHATERLLTAAARIERGIRTPAGDHPAAAAIRAALWPS